jgi:hypothetical protein
MDDLTTIAGIGINTKEIVKTNNRSMYDVILNRWNDGHPYDYVVTTQGDGTVIKDAAVFNSKNIRQGSINANHGDIVDMGVNAVLGTFGLGKTMPLSVTQNPEMVFYLGSPARMVVNCQGNEYNSDEMGFVVLDRVYDTCRVTVIGTGDGAYHLIAGRTDELDSFKYFEDLITKDETKEINFEFTRPMLGMVGSVDYLKSLVLTDIEKLLTTYGKNQTLSIAKQNLLSDDYEKSLLGIFRFRRESENWIDTNQLVRSLVLLLGTEGLDFNDKIEQMDLQSEVFGTVNTIENLKGSSGKTPTLNGSRSYAEYEEMMVQANKYASEDNDAMAYANYLAARMYLYEVW